MWQPSQRPLIVIGNVWSTCYYVTTLFRNQKTFQRAERVVLSTDVTLYDQHSELLSDNPRLIKMAPTPHHLGILPPEHGTNVLIYTLMALM